MGVRDSAEVVPDVGVHVREHARRKVSIVPDMPDIPAAIPADHELRDPRLMFGSRFWNPL
jgi:hypothetical protein